MNNSKLTFSYQVSQGKATSKRGKVETTVTAPIAKAKRMVSVELLKKGLGTAQALFSDLAKNICFGEYDENFDCLTKDKKDIKDNPTYVEIHEIFDRSFKNQKTGFKKLILAPQELRQVALMTYCAKQKSDGVISIQQLVNCLPNEQGKQNEPKVSANKLCKSKLSLAYDKQDWSLVNDLLIELNVK